MNPQNESRRNRPRITTGAMALFVLFSALFALWACNVDSPSGKRSRQLQFDEIADSLSDAGYDRIEITVTGGGLSAPLSLFEGAVRPVTAKPLPDNLGDTYQVTVKAFDNEKPGLVFSKVYTIANGKAEEGGISIVPGTDLEPDPNPDPNPDPDPDPDPNPDPNPDPDPDPDPDPNPDPNPDPDPNPEETVPPPASVSINPGTLSLADGGDSYLLHATILPVNAKQNVVWKSSNAVVATVDSNGMVRSVGVGTTQITAQAVADTTKQKSIEVTVSKPVIVEGVDLDSDRLKLYVGGPAGTLVASIRPTSAPNLLSWESTDTSVAMVNPEGKVTGLAPGTALISVQYKGDISKADTCLVTVIKDVPVLDVGEDVSVEAGATISFSPKVTQEFGGIVEFKWSLDGDTVWDEIATAVPAALSRKYTVAGDVYAMFSVKDGEGNVVQAKRLIRVGSPAPLVVIDSPADGALVNTPIITVGYRVNNVVRTRQQNLEEGPNTVKVDTAINGQSGSNSITVNLDTKKPVVKITAPVGGLLTKESSVAVAWSVDGVAQTAQLTQALAVEGENAIVRSATDAAGNVGSETVKVNRDTRPPVVVITSPGDGTVTNLSVLPVAWTVDGVAQTAQLTQALAADGEHIIKRVATDAAGNKDSATVKVVRNTKAPLVVITSPANGFVTNLKTVPVAWTVDGAPQTAQLTQALTLEGENTITREATSPAGTKGSASIKVTRDTVAPKVVITSPAIGFVTKDSLVTLAWTVDGVPQTTQLTHKLAIEGATTILREFTDAAGNKGSASVSVTLDTKGPNAPVVSGASPTLDATPTWSWVSGGGGGNGTFRYRLNNPDLTTGAITVTTLVFTPTANLADGPNTLYVQERDAVGNWSASKSHLINIDATAPTVAIATPTTTGTYLTNKATLPISGTAADAGEVSSVTYALSGATTAAAKAASGTTTAWNFSATGLNAGVTTVTITAKDALGNSRTATLTVTRVANVVFVRAAAPAGGDGSNWTNAYNDLQAALKNHSSVDIWVAQGTYKPTTGSDRDTSFAMKRGVNMYGGFAGTETVRNPARNTTGTPSILSGDLGATGTAGNSYTVVTGAAGTILDGFTIRDAYAATAGGGISITDISMTISNCIIRNNYAAQGGGGVEVMDANPVFNNCLFINNSSGWYADAGLSGVGNVNFFNCTFWASTETIASIGIDGNGTSGLIVTIKNCIFWAAGDRLRSITAGVGWIKLSNSIVQGGVPGVSGGSSVILEIDLNTVDGPNPQFISTTNPSALNLRLQSTSAAINKGISTADGAPTSDIDGRARPQGSAPDLGAYEF